MLSKNIDTEFLDDFPKKELKENYDWELIRVSKDDTNKRSVFCGINKNDKNDCIHVKQFKIFIDQNSNQEIKQIHKEINYLCLLQQYDCIVKLDDIIVDKDIDTKKLYLIFRGNTISLNKMINSNYYNNLNNDDLIKWIIFQISFGLYILHSNKIIHNDMKPSNILIDEVGGIFISDFGSACFSDEESDSYTLYYASPEFLNNFEKRDEKYDMWALGVIIIELFIKENKFFNYKKDNKESQLKCILSKFGINENLEKDEINNLIYNDESKYEFNIGEIESKIKDENVIELIKNLVVLNPKKRFTAEQVLKSKYFEDLIEKDTFEINKIDSQTKNDFFSKLIDKNNFMFVITELISKINKYNKI
jgi:serine/threonine protein kinase